MSTESEQEFDKLGPLATPQAPPGLPLEESALRRTLLRAFHDAIAAAGAAAQDPDLDAAVHEVRKALRRARATAWLVASDLPRDDRREIMRALVAARRQLSSTRDLAVAPLTIDLLGLDEDHLVAADDVVSQARSAGPTPDQVRTALADTVAAVRGLPAIMAAALPATTDWKVLRRGLAGTYRRARKRLRKARRSRAAFHDVRKRTKELAYQLELLAAGVDGHTEALRRGLADLAEELGGVVDAIMLRDFLVAHAPPPADEASVARLETLLAAIDTHLAARMKASRKGARELFERPARRWARKVGKAVRRDHAPAAVVVPAAAAGDDDGDDQVD